MRHFSKADSFSATVAFLSREQKYKDFTLDLVQHHIYSGALSIKANKNLILKKITTILMEVGNNIIDRNCIFVALPLVLSNHSGVSHTSLEPAEC